MTPFYLLLGKHRKRQEEERDILSSQSGVRNLLPQGSVAIKEVGDHGDDVHSILLSV
jgi:hypothetical protein